MRLFNFVSLFLLLAQGSFSQTTVSVKPSGDYYAFIIGESKYDNPKLVLDRPSMDARKIKDLLIARYTFNEQNVNLMLDPSRQQILAELYNLRKKLTVNDNLLIFYAGHGYWDEQASQGYWWPRDAAIDEPSNWLSNSDLKEQIRGIKTAHTLLISDACFSGGIFKTRSAAEAIKSADLNIQMLYKMPSRRAMTSGTLTAVPDESVFFTYLVKRLNENTNQYLPSQELFSSLKQAVINNSMVVPQDGVIAEAGDEGGDFIFILRNTNGNAVKTPEANTDAGITRGLKSGNNENLFENGIEFLNEKKFKRAYDIFSKVIEAEPQNAKAYNSRGRTSLGMLNFQKAMEDFSKAIELKPDFAWAYLLRGLTKLEMGKNAASIPDFTKAIELNPRYSHAYNNRGLAKMRIRKFDEALTDFDQAVLLDAKFVVALDNRGLLKIRMNKLEEAIGDLNKATSVNPKYALAFADRGYAEILLGKMNDAETDVNAALEIDNNNVRAINYRGLIHLNRNELDLAIIDFNQAVNANTRYTDAYLNLSKAYFKKGDKTNASTNVNKALELSPNNPDAASLKAEIEKVK